MKGYCHSCKSHDVEVSENFLDVDAEDTPVIVKDQMPWCVKCFEERGWTWYPNYGAWSYLYKGSDLDLTIEV
jgi:hypothetical protein